MRKRNKTRQKSSNNVAYGFVRSIFTHTHFVSYLYTRTFVCVFFQNADNPCQCQCFIRFCIHIDKRRLKMRIAWFYCRSFCEGYRCSLWSLSVYTCKIYTIYLDQVRFFSVFKTHTYLCIYFAYSSYISTFIGKMHSTQIGYTYFVVHCVCVRFCRMFQARATEICMHFLLRSGHKLEKKK